MEDFIQLIIGAEKPFLQFMVASFATPVLIWYGWREGSKGRPYGLWLMFKLWAIAHILRIIGVLIVCHLLNSL